MTDIDERIKRERENMLNAIMPSERMRHAEKIVELEKEKERESRLEFLWMHQLGEFRFMTIALSINRHWVCRSTVLNLN